MLVTRTLLFTHLLILPNELMRFRLLCVGEIHELKEELNSLDKGKKKDAVKKGEPVLGGRQSQLLCRTHRFATLKRKCLRVF
jgi:hypothetical protein